MAEVTVKTKKDALELTGKDLPKTLDLNTMGKVLEEMQYSETDEVTSEYLKIEVGVEIRAYFLEMTTINKIDGAPGEKADAVRLLLQDGRFAINADAVVVSTCRSMPKNQPLHIACTGEEKTKTGKYKTFKIFKLS